ncbi:heterokaryon incompatibility protein-domain-containing protein [Pseudoneurospora amorphoporcata]|uniref:Heterokaryon incompatibility protein-domain-containing protein n=1 Tax=Pseudoneurospora amorphoporcata TaxID=241081 RepID=A0AAN6NS91_9PEZI|nr:heterokaryon incompatibility protein-domain-containing protein [Pseudoneurospora amorphoporcata]
MEPQEKNSETATWYEVLSSFTQPRAKNCSSNAGPNQLNGENYPYRQLEHQNTIRLLLIKPDSGEEVTYTLEHSEQAKTPYKALSYEWGLPSDDDPKITIDGHTVRIRKNLHEALKQIKSTIGHLSSLRLWVDALCINQNDNTEKSQQVQKMGAIYSGAEQVIAWLGPASNDSDYAIDILNTPGAERWVMAEELDNDPLGQSAIVSLCDRPYWKRVWIIQELFLAKEFVVMCGSRSITEHQLNLCLGAILPGGSLSNSRHIEARQLSRHEFFRSLGRSAAQQHIRAKGRQVLSRNKTLRYWLYICATCKFRASDPRDYIYALLSVSSEIANGSVSIIPDYDNLVEYVFAEINEVMKLRNRKTPVDGRGRRYVWAEISANLTINKWLNNELGLKVCDVSWYDEFPFDGLIVFYRE